MKLRWNHRDFKWAIVSKVDLSALYLAKTFRVIGQYHLHYSVRNRPSWLAIKQSQASSIVGVSIQDQYALFKLTVYREAASRHQETASCAQKPTSTSNTTVSRAVLIPKQSSPGSVDTSIPSSKQPSRGLEGIWSPCLFYHLVVLTWLRHYSARKLFTNHPRPHENGNEGKKKK